MTNRISRLRMAQGAIASSYGSTGGALFKAVTYIGNSATQSILTNIDNDLVWIKDRSTTRHHNLYDTARGATKLLRSSSAIDEVTATDGLTAFNSNGFSLGAYTEVNRLGEDFISFNWKEQAGFLDIVTWNGTGTPQNIAHALGVPPSLIIVKSRTEADEFRVYHTGLGNNQFLDLNDNGAVQTSALIWNATSPTDSVFTVGHEGFGVNDAGAEYVAYLFAELSGKSKIGTYSGSSDELTIECGFRPKLFIPKCYNDDNFGGVNANWQMYYMVGSAMKRIYANTTGAEQDITGEVDFTATGVRIDGAHLANFAGKNFIYAALG